MVVYDLLTYENGAVSIPNRELMEKYTGRVLAVGISYDRKTKEHFCGGEVLLGDSARWLEIYGEAALKKYQ